MGLLRIKAVKGKDFMFGNSFPNTWSKHDCKNRRRSLKSAVSHEAFRAHSSRRPSGQSPLDIYLGQIHETSLLGAEEEHELAQRVEDGDTEARDLMVRANLRLVVNIARCYTGKGLDLQDLIEEGNLGLLHAVESFDSTLNTRFSTYASYPIKKSIKRALVNTAKTVRIPAYMMERLTKWRCASATLQNELGRPATHEQIAKRLNLAALNLAIMEQILRVYHAVSATDRTALLDEMVQDRSKPPEVEMMEADDRARVLELLNQIEAREATVLRMHFGLYEAPRKLKDIGKCLHLTAERVRQVESKALHKLSEALKR
jgi:RNA polymerase primary sigma factor